mmetsp:Transcript_15407/g.41362  ORF Transcript_15407/g.41362 Transcript_15407/m.41362 type:complete len:104 (+) Transcript_15407:133-444(+)
MLHRLSQTYSSAARAHSEWRERSTRWRIVGRPCGQLQGSDKVESLLTTRRMVSLSRAVPIMMLMRQAREACNARSLVEDIERSFRADRGLEQGFSRAQPEEEP